MERDSGAPPPLRGKARIVRFLLTARRRRAISKGTNSGRRALSLTIYDIAREAGVSASTVSRVINGKPGVNPATRERVRALLEPQP